MLSSGGNREKGQDIGFWASEIDVLTFSWQSIVLEMYQSGQNVRTSRLRAKLPRQKVNLTLKHPVSS